MLHQHRDEVDDDLGAGGTCVAYRLRRRRGVPASRACRAWVWVGVADDGTQVELGGVGFQHAVGHKDDPVPGFKPDGVLGVGVSANIPNGRSAARVMAVTWPLRAR